MRGLLAAGMFYLLILGIGLLIDDGESP